MGRRFDPAFTIVELLIVIVIIAILAAISVVAYNGVQERSRNSKISSDLANLKKAIQAARVNTDKALINITGSGHTAGGCLYEPITPDLADLDKNTHACWTRYKTTLQNITAASGVDVTGLIDPLGRPYYIDENEQEQTGTYGPCGVGRDSIGSYVKGTTNWQVTNGQQVPYMTPGC